MSNLSPVCLDDDAPAECIPPPAETCATVDRSARGYCPDDADGHGAELCGMGLETAPYCAGPSDQGYELLEEVAGTPTPPTPVETLPATGPSDVALLVVLGLFALAIGIVLVGGRIR